MKTQVIKIATRGIWSGTLTVLRDGKTEEVLRNTDGKDNGFPFYANVNYQEIGQTKSPLKISLEGVKSDDFSIVIEVVAGPKKKER